MKNDAVVRAFELLTGTTVHRSNIPEIMGAYGCALFARSRAEGEATLDDMIHVANYTDSQLQCHGCENNCLIKKYNFSNGSIYYSGNKCEKFFTNNGEDHKPGENIYDYKYKLLFDRPVNEDAQRVIGIPRCLNIYEDYPSGMPVHHLRLKSSCPIPPPSRTTKRDPRCDERQHLLPGQTGPRPHQQPDPEAGEPDLHALCDLRTAG